MAFVRAIVLAYEKYGRSPNRVLTLGQLDKSQLEVLDARIDTGQMLAISAAAMQELDDEALGWFSRPLPWGTYGMLCRASIGSETLRLALKRWCRHHALLTRDVHLELDKNGRLTVEEACDLGEMREFCLLTILRYVHGYACWLVDSRVPVKEVTFPFPRPSHESVYSHMFPGPVRFGCATASFVFEPPYLDLPPCRDESALSAMLHNALPLAVRQYRHDRLLVERVRALMTNPKAPAKTAADLAAALHLSERSLHRHLARGGSSLQALKDDLRQQRARDLLRRTDIPLKRLVQMVGFENEKSFSRAFKSWTGTTPSQFRASGPAERSPTRLVDEV
jgi:AraC-like DNA-binding protein